MKDLRQILGQYIKRNGWEEKLSSFQAVNIYNKELKEIYPQLKDSYADGIDDGILSVVALDSVINYEIVLKKREIIEKINRILKRKVLKEIGVRIGSILK